VATNPPPDTLLHPLAGPAEPLSNYLGMFHLVLVVLDPYTNESAWLLDTSVRMLTTFSQADCRVGWLVAGDPDDCRTFLGPLAQRFLTFSDPDRDAIKALGLARLPALVDLGLDCSVIDAAEGWQPAEWRRVVERLAKILSWKGPLVPAPGDPAAFAGSPALG
jgi:hypothetical protein